MTLRKLTFSIGLLAASLMLAAPAKAETWSCSYAVEAKYGGSKSLVFVREGEGFRSIVQSGAQYSYRIIAENELAIHLYKPTKGMDGMIAVALYKKEKHFNHSMLTPLEKGGVPSSIGGACIIY